MKVTISKLVVMAFLMGMGAVSSAEIAPYYTWVDENGVTNFSQDLPNGVKATRMSKKHRFGILDLPDPPESVDTSFATTENATDESDSEKEEAEAERRARQEVEAEVQRLTLARQANCDRSRQNLANYESRARVRVKGADGEYTILSDEERQGKIDMYLREIDDNCGAY